MLGGVAAALGACLSVPSSSEPEPSSLVWIQEKEQFKQELFLPLANSVLERVKGFAWPCL